MNPVRAWHPKATQSPLVAIVFGLVAFALSPSAAGQVADSSLWVPNGFVSGLTQDSAFTYVYGSFSWVGLNSSSVHRLGPDRRSYIGSGQRRGLANYRKPQPDGRGGFVVLVGLPKRRPGESEVRIARLDSLGRETHYWDPGITSESAELLGLAVAGDWIYLYSVFGNLLGQGGVFRMSFQTGAVDANWPVSKISSVSALAVSGDDVFVCERVLKSLGNSFFTNTIRKISARTGTLDPSWVADPLPWVHQLLLLDGNLYLSGADVSDRPIIRRYQLANNGTYDASWGPRIEAYHGFGSPQMPIDIAGQWIYLRGFFNRVDELPRNRIARIHLSTGRVDSLWHPTPYVSTQSALIGLAVVNDSVWLSYQHTANGPDLQHTSIVSVPVEGNGLADSTSQLVQDYCGSLVASGRHLLLVGGRVEAHFMPRLFRLHRATGALDTTWQPSFTKNLRELAYVSVYNVQLQGDWAFVAGYTSSPYSSWIYRISRRSPALVDTVWKLRAGSVSTSCILGEYLYISGDFTLPNNLPNWGLLRVPLSGNGEVDLTWRPRIERAPLHPNGPSQRAFITNMVGHGNSLFITGNFHTVSGILGQRIARIDIATGEADPNWALYQIHPNFTPVFEPSIRLNRGWLYLYGPQTRISQWTADRKLYRIRADGSASFDNAFTPLWSDNTAESFITGLGFSSTWMYLRHVNFTRPSFIGLPRIRLSRFDLNTGREDPSWNPPFDEVSYGCELGPADEEGVFLTNCEWCLVPGFGYYRLLKLSAEATPMPGTGLDAAGQDSSALVAGYPNPHISGPFTLAVIADRIGPSDAVELVLTSSAGHVISRVSGSFGDVAPLIARKVEELGPGFYLLHITAPRGDQVLRIVRMR